MIPVIIFTVSGLLILTMVAAKKLEENRGKPLFFSNLILRGDVRMREFYHQAVHFYSEGKAKTLFFFQKQIPMRSRNSFNKLLAFLKEKKGQYVNRMRDSRLLKKSDGISEFFKNMSNVEKGNGEINDVYQDGSQEDKRS